MRLGSRDKKRIYKLYSQKPDKPMSTNLTKIQGGAGAFQPTSPSDMIPRNLTFDIERPWKPSAGGTFVMSDHAMKRMFSRSFSPETIRKALRHGKPSYGDDVRIYRVGKKQVTYVGRELLEAEGIQVVSDHGGTVVTVYRSSDF